MMRVTIEIVPGGVGEARTIGVIEFANLTLHADGTSDYAVVLKKTPPFKGALTHAWRKGTVTNSDRHLDSVICGEDEELITAFAAGHHRTKRGVYDLLYRGLVACGLATRNKNVAIQ